MRVVGGIVFAVAALVLVAALRLMEGPVDLDFLKDRIARAADVPGNDIKPEIDRISLEWGGISQPMRLVFNGLRFIQQRAIRSSPPYPRRRSPSMPGSVLQGMFLPTSLTIEAPTIEADIAREGGMLRRVFTNSDANSQGAGLILLIRAAHGRTQLPFADRPARHDPD